jgi:pimeloyl-ACP methyl ester carboxylesterase
MSRLTSLALALVLSWLPVAFDTIAAGAQPAESAAFAAPGATEAFSARLARSMANDPQLRVLREHPTLPLAARSALHRIMGNGAYPVTPSLLVGLANALKNPNASPAGANVPCALTPAHPYPVVLVHGTFEDQADNFGAISPILANNGYCVYAFNYGGATGALVQGVDSVPSSAVQIANHIHTILQQTGASKVDLVGHSQGGLQLEYVAKVEKLAPVLNRIVALDPSTHGTTLDGLVLLADALDLNGLVGGACQACIDQEVGSAVLKPFDVPPIAQPGPAYTVIETRTDEVITPPSSAFINESGVTNEYIQNSCPFDIAEHTKTPYDLVTIQLILNALNPAAAQSPNCLLEYPFPA